MTAETPGPVLTIGEGAMARAVSDSASQNADGADSTAVIPLPPAASGRRRRVSRRGCYVEVARSRRRLRLSPVAPPSDWDRVGWPLRALNAVDKEVEYDPHPPFDAGSPAKAPVEVVEFVMAMLAVPAVAGVPGAG